MGYSLSFKKNVECIYSVEDEELKIMYYFSI